MLAQTRAKFFAKINAPRYDTSFYLLGWTPGTLDALNVLSNLAATRREGSLYGVFNNGGYSNPDLDQLIGKIQVELDGKKRNDMLAESLSILRNLLYRGRVTSSSFITDLAPTMNACRLARLSLLSEVGATAAP